MTMLDARGTGRGTRAGSKAKNWPQTHDLPDPGAVPDLSAVTVARTGGVEAPTSTRRQGRQPRKRIGLPPTARVSTPDVVLKGAARAAAESLAPIVSATREVADAFRRRELGQAQANLGDLFRTLRTLTLVTSRLATRGAPMTAGNPVTLYARLMRLLDEFAARQRAEDWDGVARLLTTDLEDVLAEWPTALRAFAPDAVSPDVAGRVA